jgi:hypothetical protein
MIGLENLMVANSKKPGHALAISYYYWYYKKLLAAGYLVYYFYKKKEISYGPHGLQISLQLLYKYI